ncbi:hypothetical protein [Nitrospirillum pindoramense]
MPASRRSGAAADLSCRRCQRPARRDRKPPCRCGFDYSNSWRRRSTRR